MATYLPPFDPLNPLSPATPGAATVDHHDNQDPVSIPDSFGADLEVDGTLSARRCAVTLDYVIDHPEDYCLRGLVQVIPRSSDPLPGDLEYKFDRDDWQANNAEALRPGKHTVRVRSAATPGDILAVAHFEVERKPKWELLYFKADACSDRGDDQGRITFTGLTNGWEDYDEINLNITRVFDAETQTYVSEPIYQDVYTFASTGAIGDGIGGPALLDPKGLTIGTYTATFNNGYCEQLLIFTICENCGALAGNENEDVNGRTCETCERTTLSTIQSENCC